MRSETGTHYARSLPPMAVALADITIAAAQRSFAVNAAAVEHLLSQGIAQSQDAGSNARATMPGLPGTLLGPTALEQLWRYTASMLAIYQSATASMANLLTAQIRGADKEVESLSKEAHDEVAEAAATAAAAAGSVMSNGIAAMSRITEIASQAGSAIGEQVQSQMEAAGEAGGAGEGNGRSGQRGSARRQHAKRPTARRAS